MVSALNETSDRASHNPVWHGPFVDKSQLYRFPWSTHDNPIGWLEMTDACDLTCKGCYRRKLAGHKPYEEIQADIRMFREKRNCDCVVLAGGEPLTHPKILDIIAYITEQGMKPHLATSGSLFDLKVLKEMEKAGLTGMGVHVDSKQGRRGWEGKTELEMNALREDMADMVRSAGGMTISFGVTVFPDTLKDVPMLARWTVENRHRVGGHSFITYRGAPMATGRDYLVNGERITLKKGDLGYTTDENEDQLWVTAHDVLEKIRESVPEFEPSAFLGGTNSPDSVKWLIGLTLATKDRVLGSIGPKTMEFAQVMHHLRHGTYLTYTKGWFITRWILALGLFDRKVRRIWGRHLLNPLRLFRRIQGVSFGIVQAPDIMPDGSIDMCDSCPDMTVWEGRFINSCRMEEYRKFGGLLTPLESDNGKQG